MKITKISPSIKAEKNTVNLKKYLIDRCITFWIIRIIIGIINGDRQVLSDNSLDP